jgi:formylglycine-generating enzyme required for sulfatase activity
LKGVFTSVSTLVNFAAARGGKGNAALVACADGKGNFYEFFGLESWRSSHIDKVAGRRATRLSAVKGSPLAAVRRTKRTAMLPWRGAMTLSFADGHLRGRIIGLTLEADDRSFPRGQVGVRAVDTEAAFDGFFVSGVLDRAWLEGALGISGDRPPAAKVQSSTRRAGKAAGQASAKPAAPARASPAGAAPKPLTLDLGGGVTMEMIAIKPGAFMMGSNEVPRGEASGLHKPVHEVAITRGFYMSRHKVTQKQFEAVTGANPSQKPDPKLPVETVTWWDAGKFCRIATQKTGRQFRLPTEAEWEYACRAGTKLRGDPKGRPPPPGIEGPNAWGLHDMYAHTWEWVADWYGEDYYAKSPREDPTGPAKGTFRVLRGRWFIGGDGVLYPRRTGKFAPAFRQTYVSFRAAASEHTLASSAKFLRGLVGHWKFDEGAGTVAYDSSGRGNQGTVKGGAKWAKGVLGGALEFDGKDDYVDCGNAPSLRIQGGMTLSIWAKPDTVSQEGGLASKWVNSWCWVLTPSGKNALHFDSWRVANTTVPVGEWSHLAVVYSDAEDRICFYYNGRPDGTQQQTLKQGTGANLTIGRRGTPPHVKGWFRGLLDDVRIYDRALPADEIKDLAAAR